MSAMDQGIHDDRGCASRSASATNALSGTAANRKRRSGVSKPRPTTRARDEQRGEGSSRSRGCCGARKDSASAVLGDVYEGALPSLRNPRTAAVSSPSSTYGLRSMLRMTSTDSSLGLTEIRQRNQFMRRSR